MWLGLAVCSFFDCGFDCAGGAVFADVGLVCLVCIWFSVLRLVRCLTFDFVLLGFSFVGLIIALLFGWVVA